MFYTDLGGAPSGPVLILRQPVRLGLPFAIYELRLRHRLLDNLQSVSRVLLRALARGATIETILTVTALSAETIHAQCDYLRYQGYLGDGVSLAALGEEVVLLEGLLPGCVKRVGIDRFGGKNIFVLPSDDTVDLDPCRVSGAPDATLPEERHLKQFDHQSRVAEILIDNDCKGLLDFANYFWSEHSELFARQLRHLDFSLRPLAGHPGELICVDVVGDRLVPVDRLRGREAGVVLPVLEIARCCEAAPGWPWPVMLAPPDRLWLDLFSHASLPLGLPLVDTADDQLRVLAERQRDDVPDLPPFVVPAGTHVRHELRRRYLNLRVEGSLMEMVRAEYGFLILGDAHA